MQTITGNFLSLIENIASTYATDTIYILGKGPSVDLVDPQIYANSLVIGLNDAERIAPADITIFHGSWVKGGLRESGYRSRLYLTAQPGFKAGDKAVVEAPLVHLNQETSELLMQRMMTDSLEIEEVLFVTALKLSRMIAGIRGRSQTVYMLGFDFSAEKGHSRALVHDYADDSEDERLLKISAQEFYFLNALYALRDSPLDIRHVGYRSFSGITPEELNGHAGARFATPESRVDVVAELTTNHFGDRFRLEKMIRASKAAGANYIKLQKRDVESFYSREQLSSPYNSPFGRTFGDYRHQLELSQEDFLFVDALCRDLSMGWFASVLDEPSFHVMVDIGVPMVKLPSTISEHKNYLKFVAENYRGSVVLSTGMTDESYERFVTEAFVECEKIYLLQCNSAYPTPLEHCNIGVVRHYHGLSRQNPRIVPGYSSHDHGWKASALAVAAGARMLEKHVKLGNTEWAHFDAVAVDLTTSDFREYVDHIREAELIMGSDQKRVNESEHHKYRK